MGISVNPIIQKAATLLIIQFNARTVLSKTKQRSHGKMSLLSAPGNENNTYEITSRGVVLHPDHVLVKTSTKIVTGRQRDAQTIKFPEAYALLS